MGDLLPEMSLQDPTQVPSIPLLLKWDQHQLSASCLTIGILHERLLVNVLHRYPLLWFSQNVEIRGVIETPIALDYFPTALGQTGFDGSANPRPTSYIFSYPIL